MLVITTTYNRTDKGLVLRNNFTETTMEYDLKEYLLEFTDTLEELEYQVNSIKHAIKVKGYSTIIESEKNGIIYHKRFIK